MLQADLEISIVSLEDMYGGKLVAAMDRQHPRDLFDVMKLFVNEGITPGIRRAFVVYLASHNRPVHEVLFPTLRDIRNEYENNFQGMTEEPVELGALLAARDRMMRELQHELSAAERRFLLSLVAPEPEWPLLEIEHIESFPALRWKLQNLEQIRKRNARKFAEQSEALARLLAWTLKAGSQERSTANPDNVSLTAHNRVEPVRTASPRCWGASAHPPVVHRLWTSEELRAKCAVRSIVRGAFRMTRAIGPISASLRRFRGLRSARGRCCCRKAGAKNVAKCCYSPEKSFVYGAFFQALSMRGRGSMIAGAVAKLRRSTTGVECVLP